jgi:hypothetical protein
MDITCTIYRFHQTGGNNSGFVIDFTDSKHKCYGSLNRPIDMSHPINLDNNSDGFKEFISSKNFAIDSKFWLRNDNDYNISLVFDADNGIQCTVDTVQGTSYIDTMPALYMRVVWNALIRKGFRPPKMS